MSSPALDDVEIAAARVQAQARVQVAAAPGCEAAPGASRRPARTAGDGQAGRAAGGRGWFAPARNCTSGRRFVPARKAHPALRVTLRRLARARLEGAGAPVTWDHRLPGFRRFFTEDPWGNRLELLAVDAIAETTR